MRVRALLIGLILGINAMHVLAAEANVRVEHHAPMNLFFVGDPVAFNGQSKESAATKATVTVTDYFGNTVKKLDVAIEAGNFHADLGSLPPGYYEMSLASADGERAVKVVTFGVVHRVHRTAAEVRGGGYRFGLKKWNFGVDPKTGLEWPEEEAMSACCDVGLQWTRELLQEKKNFGPIDMATKLPINVIMKVERFPKDLYDASRYGPLADWEAKYGKGSWTLQTLPMKEPYQAWLRDEVKLIPQNQNVFEIWNEAWNKMSPEDFATLCNWASEAILAVRPDAIIGPNLWGSDSPYQFDAKMIEAGGMKDMKMVALHPYATSEDRAWLRQYRDWVSKQVGHPIDIYVTEFGSHSTPQGPAHRSEHEQAQRVIRQAVALYAEDVKAFTPHWLGQSEADPTYLEDWFGFFRLAQQPKPVLVAYANAARLIDGSRYVGDLWLGPGNDAMLFERNGVFTLAVGTRGESKQVELNPGVDKVTLCDMVGGEKSVEIAGGTMSIEAGPDWAYVIGVSPSLERQASKALRPDRWPAREKPPRTTRTIKGLTGSFAADGKLDEFKGATQVALLNPKVAGDDASGTATFAWDEQNLYLAVEMRDNELLNNRARAKLYTQDSIELFVSTEPRDDKPGYGPHDHQFIITPTSNEGHPIAAEVTNREASTLTDIRDAKLFASKVSKGWMVEIAIPWKTMPDFAPAKGSKLALDIRVNDADTAHERFKIDPVDAPDLAPQDPTGWSFLVLE